jgi:hypothetical protein
MDESKMKCHPSSRTRSRTLQERHASAETKTVSSDYFDEMPSFLKCIHQVIGNEKKELQTESGWSVISLEEFEKSAANHRSDGQETIRMFAHRYEGMGWQFLAYYVIETKQAFIVMGGGSNGYESYQNWVNAMAFDPTTLTNEQIFSVEDVLSWEFEDAELNTVNLPSVAVDFNNM